MKRLLTYLAAIVVAMSAYADKLPEPVKMEVVKDHIFGFDRESLADNPYFIPPFSAGNIFTFDGENLLLTTKDGKAVNNPVSKFAMTQSEDDNTWQYIITLAAEGDFPTVVEIKLLPNNKCIILFPMSDSKSGDTIGMIVSECKVIP